MSNPHFLTLSTEADQQYQQYLLGEATFEATLTAVVSAAADTQYLKSRAWHVLGSWATLRLHGPGVETRADRLYGDVLYNMDNTMGTRQVDLRHDMWEQGINDDPVTNERAMRMSVNDTPAMQHFLNVMGHGGELALRSFVGAQPLFEPSDAEPNLR